MAEASAANANPRLHALDPSEDPVPTAPAPASRGSLLRWLRPSATHTNFSATLLLMSASLLSAILGLVRTKYIAYTFALPEADAYNAAFELPDMINYFLIGGVASIPLITILNRYRHREGEPNDDAGADLALSHILNAMLAVLAVATLLAEFLVPIYTRYKFPGFRGDKAALCNTLTRIILPAQLFFFAGGVLSSRLLVRKIFTWQAMTPLVYNTGIILGGVLLSRRIGVYSLAIGVLLGVVAGPFALNGFAALRGGMRYRPVFNLRHPAFREWLRLSLPLMAGASLVTADKWIQTYFASSDGGAITRLTYAKTLFTAPMGILGQAAGAASLPFFAALWRQGRRADFGVSVNRSVSRIIAASLLLSGLMLTLARPIVDLLLRGGSFHRPDAQATALYFSIFTASLFLWTAQAIYARAFYAAGNTLTPAIAGTVITLVSIPFYALLFRTHGVRGLVYASDLGILLQTSVLAALLDRRGWVRLGELEFAEIARAGLAALAAALGAALTLRYLPGVTAGTYRGDLITLLCALPVWAGLAILVLRLTGSGFLQQIRRRNA